MTEDCMELISCKAEGPTSLALLFSVKKLNLIDEDINQSPKYNIHNIAEICFLLKLHNDDDINYGLMSRKHTWAKDLLVQLHVVCKDPKFDDQFLSAEEWGKNITMGWRRMGVLGIELLHIVINITVIKPDLNMKLYEDEKFTDFKLSTDDGSLAVHKAHLAANSDVFNMMLSREWKETSEGRIQIEGVSLQTLKHLKQYIYLGTVPDDGLLSLLLVARYYLMDTLKAQCLLKISQTVTSENLYEIMEYSCLNNVPELMFNVMETVPRHIIKNAYEIMIKNQKSFERAEEKTKKEENQEKAEEQIQKEENNTNNQEKAEEIIQEENNTDNQEKSEELIQDEENNTNDREKSEELMQKKENNTDNQEKAEELIIQKDENNTNDQEKSKELIQKTENITNNQEKAEDLIQKEENNTNDQEKAEELIQKEENNTNDQEKSKELIQKVETNTNNQEKAEESIQKEENNTNDQEKAKELIPKEENNTDNQEKAEEQIRKEENNTDNQEKAEEQIRKEE